MLDVRAAFSYATKSTVEGKTGPTNEKKDSKGQIKEANKRVENVAVDESTRGLRFILALPPDADAHYAGKGVKLGAANTPIFWYHPKDAKKYRVIYADLSVREAAAPPNVPNAQPVPGAGRSEEIAVHRARGTEEVVGKTGTRSAGNVILSAAKDLVRKCMPPRSFAVLRMTDRSFPHSAGNDPFAVLPV